MKKKLYLVLFLLIAALAVTSCGNGDDPAPAQDEPAQDAPAQDAPAAEGDAQQEDDPEDEAPEARPVLPGLDRPVTILTWGDPYDTIEELFYELYGGTIEWIFAGWDVYMEAFLSMLMAGHGPDVLQIQEVGLVHVVASDFLMPVDDLLDLNAPHWVTVANNPMLMRDGQNMGVVMMNSVWYHLFYSRPMFFAAGEEYPSAALARGAWTWERMFEMAENLSQDTTGDGFNNIWGLATEGVHIPQMAMFATNNTGFIGMNPDGTLYNNVEDPTIARLLEQFYTAASVRDTVVTADDGASQFAIGNAAMFFGGYWYVFGDEEPEPGSLAAMFRAGQFGMVPSPTPCGTIHGPRMGNIGVYGMSRNANNPEGGAVLLDLMRRHIYAQQNPETEDEEFYLLEQGFNLEQIGFVYNIGVVPYTDLYFDFPWWDPFFGVAFGYEWTAMREGFWADVQFVVDMFNDDL